MTRLGRIFRCRATKHAAELKTCGASCGTLHAQIDRGLRPRIKGSVALLRRMCAKIRIYVVIFALLALVFLCAGAVVASLVE